MRTEQEELFDMQMVAVMTATLQNTESTIKDRIDRSSPYWTQAYADVCVAINREMKLIERVKQLKQALVNIKNEIGVPQPGYPQPVANAYDIASNALTL